MTNIQLPLNVNKVITWGHKNNDNTFFYIHQGYMRAFKHLNIEFHWFDDSDDVSRFDFSNTLFFTEGQVDKNIPIRNDCLYVLHNCYDPKYDDLKTSHRAVMMQTFTDDVYKYKIREEEPGIHTDYEGGCIYFFWPTDILPHEIESNKPTRVLNKESKSVHWVGTVGGGEFGNEEQLAPFIKACNENGISFDWKMQIGVNDNIDRIKSSYMAPTITGAWQKTKGYIPCRISKNISYGQFGITNSLRIYEVYGGKLIYNGNEYKLFYEAKERLANMQLSELHSLMDYVKEKHTYLNRIQSIFNFIEKICQ